MPFLLNKLNFNNDFILLIYRYWTQCHIISYFSITATVSLACCTPYITRHRAFYVANGKWAYTNNNLTLVLQRSIAISIIGTYELIGISMSFLTAYRLKMYGMRSKKNEKVSWVSVLEMKVSRFQNLIFVTSLHILVDIVAMLIMIAEFLEWQFPLALFAVKNVFFCISLENKIKRTSRCFQLPIQL